jgi:hypothetical protein
LNSIILVGFYEKLLVTNEYKHQSKISEFTIAKIR